MIRKKMLKIEDLFRNSHIQLEDGKGNPHWNYAPQMKYLHKGMESRENILFILITNGK